MFFFSLFLHSHAKQMQLIDGGRIDRLKGSFPSLRNLIRLQTILSLKKDALSVAGRSLFGQSRNEFLERIYYPELSNQALCLMKKWKLGNQYRIAKQELANRKEHGRRSFFVDMTDDQLSHWIFRAVQPLTRYMYNLCQSSVTVGRPVPSLGVAIPRDNHLRYSFMSEEMLAANKPYMTQALTTTLVNARIGLSVHPVRHPVRDHPTNLAIVARIAKGLPVLVKENSDSSIHPDDDDMLKTDVHENQELSNFMSFLSYNIYRPYRNTPRNCVALLQNKS